MRLVLKEQLGSFESHHSWLSSPLGAKDTWHVVDKLCALGWGGVGLPVALCQLRGDGGKETAIEGKPYEPDSASFQPSVLGKAVTAQRG